MKKLGFVFYGEKSDSGTEQETKNVSIKIYQNFGNLFLLFPFFIFEHFRFPKFI